MNINQNIAPGASPNANREPSSYAEQKLALAIEAARRLPANARLRSVFGRQGQCLGHIWKCRPSGFRAYSRAGELIGEYPDAQLAETAVHQAVRP